MNYKKTIAFEKTSLRGREKVRINQDTCCIRSESSQILLNPFAGIVNENAKLENCQIKSIKMGGRNGRKRGRRLAFLAPLLVVTSGDNSDVDLIGTLQGNQGSPYHQNTSCAAFSWEQNDELHQTAVIFGSTTGTAAASTCRPSAPDPTPCKFSSDIF